MARTQTPPDEKTAEQAAEDLRAAPAAANQMRREGLVWSGAVGTAKEVTLNQELARRSARFGADSAEAEAQRQRIQAHRAVQTQIQAQSELAEIDVPERRPDALILHGRVVDGDRLGRPGLTVAAIDSDGKVRKFDCTDDVGYFKLEITPRAGTASNLPERVFLQVSDDQQTVLYRGQRWFPVTPGRIVYYEIVLTDLEARPCPPPPGGEPEPPAEIGLTFEKGALQSQAVPGQEVTFTFTLSNTGQADLLVDVEDRLGTTVTRFTSDLPVNTDRIVSKPIPIPLDASGHIENSARAVGRASDGRQVEAVATHSTQIRRPDDFTLIGMMQAKGAGNLADNGPAYEAQLFTFRDFAADSATPVLQKAYARVLETQADQGKRLVGVWQGFARQLAETEIHAAGDVVAFGAQRLKEMFPDLSDKRIQRWLTLAREKAEA